MFVASSSLISQAKTALHFIQGIGLAFPGANIDQTLFSQI